MYSKRATPTIRMQAAGAPPLSTGAAQAHACMLALNSMGDHHGISSQHPVARAVEQGRDRRPQGAVQGQGHLGTPSPAPNGEPRSRARAVQPGHRLQASRLRRRLAQGARCLPRRRCGQPRGGDAAEDSAHRSVRDHAGDPRSRATLDQASGTERSTRMRARTTSRNDTANACCATSPSGPGSSTCRSFPWLNPPENTIADQLLAGCFL